MTFVLFEDLSNIPPMSKWIDWSALVGYCGLIFWLSAQETLPVPQVFNFQDKLIHAGAYFTMGAFCWRAFRHLGLQSGHLALLSILFCSVYGLSDEWHQSFVPGRSSSGWDWLADTVGACLAAGLLQKLQLSKRI